MSMQRLLPARLWLARVAATVAVLAIAAAVPLIVAALSSPVFASDFENGTHDYQGGAAIPYLLVTAALALALGCFGAGRAALCCRVVVGLIVAGIIALRFR